MPSEPAWPGTAPRSVVLAKLGRQPTDRLDMLVGQHRAGEPQQGAWRGDSSSRWPRRPSANASDITSLGSGSIGGFVTLGEALLK